MFRSIVSVLAVLIVSASVVRAALPVADHQGSLPILLGVEKVRDELKLNSLQRAVLDSIREEYKTEANKLFSPMPTTPSERAAAEGKLAKLNARYNERALATLNSKQRARVIEVEHRVLGGTLLYSPGVQAKLGLSADQVKKIESIRQKGLVSTAKINRRYEEGKIGYQERVLSLRKSRLAQGEALLKILSETQRNAFMALGGKKVAS